MDLSVVVASHANLQGCYLTVFSLIFQLKKLNIQWELIIVSDGGTEYQWEKLPNVRCLRILSGSPQGTRDAGIRAAQAETVLVVEDHVLVDDIQALYESHNALGGAMTFPARIGEGTSLFNVYGTTTNFDGNLWFKRTLYRPVSGYPYRVPQFGHSCFVVNKKYYIAVGGYTDLLTGWGFEEPLLCLKFWMLGHTLWLVPTTAHAHFLADRTNGAMLSDHFLKNAAIVKYVLTGEVTGNLQITAPLQEERNRIVSGPYGGDFKKLREYFYSEGIADRG